MSHYYNKKNAMLLMPFVAMDQTKHRPTNPTDDLVRIL